MLRIILRCCIGVLFIYAPFASAAEWCTVKNFGVSDNSGTVSIHGDLVGATGTSSHVEWLLLDRSTDSNAVKNRLAMAMTAAVSGNLLMIYVDQYACNSVPAWQKDVVLHMRIFKP